MSRVYVRPEDRNYRPSPGAIDDLLHRAQDLMTNHRVHGVTVNELRLGQYQPGEELGMTVTLVRIEAGGHNPLHEFSEPELVCVLSGTLRMGGVRSEPVAVLEAGSVAYLDADEPFWYEASPESPVELLIVFPRTPRLGFKNGPVD